MTKFDKIAGGISSGLAGLSGILGSALSSAQINNTNSQDEIINNISDLGGTGYSSFDQISDAYASLDSMQPNLDFDAIRGGSDGERIGNVLSSMASGASAGSSFGGGWGALGGALAGLGAGIGGWLAGDAKAENEQMRLKNDLAIARYKAGLNLESRANNIQDKQFRSGVVNSSASGGHIKRHQSIISFADSVLGKTRKKSYNPNNTIVREMCEGGIRIRIKK